MTKSPKQIQIPQDCIRFTFSRSPGPGGQNVNKLNTKATLIFDIIKCPVFSGRQKSLILEKLVSRTDKNGHIHITCSRFRTQSANRRAALERLCNLLSSVLKVKTPRKKTSPPASSVKKRLKLKKKRSDLKKYRSVGSHIQDQ